MLTIFQQFGDSFIGAGDGRFTELHGLTINCPAGLAPGRKHEDVTPGHVAQHVLVRLFTQKFNMISDAEAVDQRLEILTLRATANNPADQGGKFGNQFSNGLNKDGMALTDRKRPYGQHDQLVRILDRSFAYLIRDLFRVRSRLDYYLHLGNVGIHIAELCRHPRIFRYDKIRIAKYATVQTAATRMPLRGSHPLYAAFVHDIRRAELFFDFHSEVPPRKQKVGVHNVKRMLTHHFLYCRLAPWPH